MVANFLKLKWLQGLCQQLYYTTVGYGYISFAWKLYKGYDKNNLRKNPNCQLAQQILVYYQVVQNSRIIFRLSKPKNLKQDH